jgi:hypothetical protein
MTWSALPYNYPLMGGDVCRAGRLEDPRGRGDLLGRAVRHHEELGGRARFV